jgi:hypothetical protein
MNNLLTAIMTKITTGPSAFSTDVGGRIYLDQAPQGTEFPYCVFFIVSDVPEKTFGKGGKTGLIQFSLFSSSSGATEITTMYNDLDTLMDECSMSITSSSLVYFKRSNLTTMVDEITTPEGTTAVKHWAVDFEYFTQLT